MISRFRVQNYKALRDVTLDLTPVHALIGPNDSGKTSLLEAVAALGRSVDRPLSDIFLTDWTGKELLTVGGGDTVRLSCWVPGRLGLDYFEPGEEPNYALDLLFACGGAGGEYEILADDERLSFIPPGGGGEILGQELRDVSIEYGSLSSTIWPRYKQGEFGPEWAPTGWVLHEIVRECAPVQYLRWNPKALAMPSAINTARAGRLEVNGFGLPTLLDAVRDADGPAYAAVQEEFRGFFPDVRAVRLVVRNAFDAKRRPPRRRL